MTSSKLRASLLLFCVCVLVGTPAFAVTSSGATYAMPVSVLNAGEGDMSSATYRLRSSLGEPVAGVTSSGTSYKLASGFVSAVFVPIVQLTPSKLDFPAQAMGVASATQTIQITNLGAAPLSISGVAVNGDFSQTNTCTSVLQGGMGCTLSVTFSPTAADARTGTLSFNSNAPGSTTQIALTGTGTAVVASAPVALPTTTAPPTTTTAPAAVSASTGTSPLCAPPVPPSKTGAPVALTQDVTVRDTVAKGQSCVYSASVSSGQTYVMSITGIVGAAELKLFNDAALTQPTACLSPNLVNSIFRQPADCSFVATSGAVYASVTGTSYLATADNSYNIRVSPHFDAAPATQGTETSPIEIPTNKPYGGTAGPAWSDNSYYLVNTTGSSGDVVISMTGMTGAQTSTGLSIYDNAKFIGPKLDSKSCNTPDFKTFAQSCNLPAGKTYYLRVTTGRTGGPFTLMVDTTTP
jgi:hypothetical protein